MAEQMDAFTAVFNGHVNRADKRARAYMKKRAPRSLEMVRRCERKGGGIMAIFLMDATKAQQRAYLRYALLVQKFVNERR